MNREIVEKIKCIYDTDAEKYSFNRNYSNDERAVYTKSSKPDEWLTITKRDKGHYMATRTDSTGIITNREIYKTSEKGFECVYEEKVAPKRKKVSVRERLEINKIRFGQKRIERNGEVENVK